jgi:hypothetical protein
MGAIRDRLDAHRAEQEARAAALDAPVAVTPDTPTPDADATPAAARDEDRPRRSQATRIVDLALEAGVELWHALSGDPHVTLRADGHREHHRLTARPVRDWLARHHHTETGAVPGGQAIGDALTVLAGMARYSGATHPVAVRVAGDSAAVYLDLGDPTWRAVEVTADGWRLVSDPPVRFIRSRGMLALAHPMPGGTLDDLRALCHVASDDDYRLLGGWLLGALRPTGPYPLLSLVGEQGTGKSTAARVVRRLIDPHVAELRAEPRTIDDVMIGATRSRVLALDNLSHLPAWLSDALCRVSTGGALAKRELYTDDDEVLIEAMRPTIVTSIADIVTRGDLLDRAIVVTLPVLDDRTRLAEAELWRRFDAAAPRILGALLDGVAGALARVDDVTLDELPRMADWATWATAAEPALGWPEQTIVAAYRAMRGAAIEATLDGDPLASALRRLSWPWTGTAGDLLDRLRPADRVPRGWPESPRALSSALRRLAPALRRVGVEVTTRREAHTGRRLLTLDEVPERPSRPSPSSPEPIFRADPGDATGDANPRPSPRPSPQNAPISGLCDGGDGGDGPSQPSLEVPFGRVR